MAFVGPYDIESDGERAAREARSERGSRLLAACSATPARAAEALRLLDGEGAADLNALDAQKRSALMHACEDASGALDAVAARLIARGARLDFADDNDGATALVKACAKRRAATALLLVKAGAAFAARGLAGAALDAIDVEYSMTALDYALAGNLAEVAAAILERGGRTAAHLEAARDAKAAAAAVMSAMLRGSGEGVVEALKASVIAAKAREVAEKKKALLATAAALVRSAREAVARDAAAHEAAAAAGREAVARAEAAARASAAAVPPFRGPAADTPLGELFIDALSVACAHAHGLDLRHARYVCGATFRLGARRADGSLDRAGFLGGTADMIDCATRLQAPWLEAARRAPRKGMVITTAPRVTRTDDSTTGLMRAAAAGDEQRLHELLAAGAPLRCVDLWGRTALHWACEQGSERAVAALLAADAEGATIEARDNAGNVPLARACYFGHEGAVRALLARGARQGLQGDRGWAALHCAAFKGHAGVVALLCAAPGAAEAMRLRTEGEDMVHLGLMGPAFTEGDSALGLALAHGRELCAEVLWASGARA